MPYVRAKLLAKFGNVRWPERERVNFNFLFRVIYELEYSRTFAAIGAALYPPPQRQTVTPVAAVEAIIESRESEGWWLLISREMPDGTARDVRTRNKHRRNAPK